MYLLFVDESGTHGASHSFILGAMGIHEDDAPKLQKGLDQLVIDHLGRVPLNLEDYELHATDLRNAKKPSWLRESRPSGSASGHMNPVKIGYGCWRMLISSWLTFNHRIRTCP